MPRTTSRRHLRTEKTTETVVDLLPLNGAPVRSGDLERLAEKARIPWRTALRHLREAERRGIVVATAGIVDGIPAKFYALDIARRLREFGEGFPEFQRRIGEILSPLPGRKAEVLKMHLSMVQRMTAASLRGAIRAPSREQAIAFAELVVENVLRRWVKGLTGLAWDTRPESAEVLGGMLSR